MYSQLHAFLFSKYSWMTRTHTLFNGGQFLQWYSPKNILHSYRRICEFFTESKWLFEFASLSGGFLTWKYYMSGHPNFEKISYA